MAPRGEYRSARNQRFAQLVHEGTPPLHAYTMAGYKPSPRNPYHLLQTAKTQGYLRKLEERTMKQHDITIEKVIGNLEEALDMGRDTSNPTAIINAAMSQAKLVGLVVEKKEIKNVSDMSKDELITALRASLGEQADAVLEALGMESWQPELKPANAQGTDSVQ